MVNATGFSAYDLQKCFKFWKEFRKHIDLKAEHVEIFHITFYTGKK